MDKYFKNADTDIIVNEEISRLFRRADKRPEKFIRIALDQEKMLLSYKGGAEFEITQATFFLCNKHGEFYRYDFSRNDPSRQFHAAIDPDTFIAFSLDDPKFPAEGLLMFNSNEMLLGLLKTQNSTIFLIYDNESDHIGYGYHVENPGYPSIYETLMQLLEIRHPLIQAEEESAGE